MLRTLDPSMLGLSHSIQELAPWAAKYGFQAVSAVPLIFQDKSAAWQAADALAAYGLSWGLMPMPADFYHWDLDDTAFEAGLETLRRQADTARALGITRAYNHVWPCSSREYDENFSWIVKRLRAVHGILQENGISYGLEFLGPHELRALAKHTFTHSLSGVMDLADAAGEGVGIVFDVFHWYCSQNSAMEDVMLMEKQLQRLVAVHLSDAVTGRAFDQQKDMERCLPGETGVIDAKTVLSHFRSSNALYMAEPFQPWCTKLGKMTAEEAVRTVSQALARVE